MSHITLNKMKAVKLILSLGLCVLAGACLAQLVQLADATALTAYSFAVLSVILFVASAVVVNINRS
jgi:hypothetical protein